MSRDSLLINRLSLLSITFYFPNLSIVQHSNLILSFHFYWKEIKIEILSLIFQGLYSLGLMSKGRGLNNQGNVNSYTDRKEQLCVFFHCKPSPKLCLQSKPIKNLHKKLHLTRKTLGILIYGGRKLIINTSSELCMTLVFIIKAIL